MIKCEKGIDASDMLQTKQVFPDDTSYFLHRLESNVFLYTRILFILGVGSFGFLLRNALFYLPHYYIARYYFYIYLLGCLTILPTRAVVSSLYKKQDYKAVNTLIIISASEVFILLVLLSVLDSVRIVVNEPSNDYNFTGYILGLFIMGFVLRLDSKLTLAVYAAGISIFLTLYYFYSPRVLSLPSVLPFIAVNILALYFSYSREKFYKILHEDNTDLLNQTFRDSLTQSFNRRYMKRAVHQSFTHKLGAGVPFCCIFTDIDFFKDINDKYGHDAGDMILIEFSRILQNETRSMDSVIRYGGEEFVILLSNTRLDEAKGIADRMRRGIEETSFYDNRISVTASFGVTEAADRDTEESIIQRADSLLYRAKREGRNRVCAG